MKLREYLSKNMISQLEFSEKSGIHYVNLNRLINKRHLPSLTTMKKIEKATNGVVKMNDFLDEDDSNEKY